MLRRWTGLLLAATWIAVSNSSPVQQNVARPTRQLLFAECCPCPRGAGRLADTELDAVPDDSTAAAVTVPSVGRSAGAGECPCCQREADSLGAASGPVPDHARAAGPFNMPSPTEPKEEGKPLLHPEVDLASSVLETLREATDEEYRDALERDAARSAAADENSLEASKNIVTIILNPATENTEKVDDTDIAGTHVQEARCINSPLEASRTTSELSEPQNFLEDIDGIPRFQHSGLSKSKLLLFDSNPSASEVRESVVDAPVHSLKPPLLKLLPGDKLHLDKRGVKDLIKVYRMSKDILDENTILMDEKSTKDGVQSGTIPDFGINTKISDLNERIDQLNDLSELTKIPKLKIDGKYSKVAKGIEILEDSEEMTNADSLQAPSEREDTASPANDVQNVPDFRAANKLNTFNEGIMKSVPDLVTTAKNLLKLKDVELIPSKVVDTAAKASQSRRPNLKLLTIDEIISKVKAINLRDLIPTEVTSSRPGPIVPQNFANVVGSDVAKGGSQIFKDDFDNNTQNFETEIIDTVPSSSVSQTIINTNEKSVPAIADASECNVKQNEPRGYKNVGAKNQEVQEQNNNEAKQLIFSAESDDDFESETIGSTDRSLDVDRGTGLKLADKLERLSDKLKQSEMKSKTPDVESITQNDTKDTEDLEPRNGDPTNSQEKESLPEDPRNNIKMFGTSQSDLSPKQLRFKPRIVTDDMPVGSLSQEKTKARGGNVANEKFKTSADTCISNVREEGDNSRSSKNSEPAAKEGDIPTSTYPFKTKRIRTHTAPNKILLQAKRKVTKDDQEKKSDMTPAASERVNNFLDSHQLRQAQSIFFPNSLRSESNLQAPGPWTLWSGLEHDWPNQHPRLSPEKFKDLFEGLSRARVNDGMPGIEGPVFPERLSQSGIKLPFKQDRGSIRLPLSGNDGISGLLQSRLKSPFKQDKGPLRPFLLSGTTIDEMAQGLPTLAEMRSRAQEFLSSPKLINTGIPDLKNLRTSEPLKQLEDLRDNLHKNAASAVSNLQQTLSSTLEVAKVRDENFLTSSLYAQPENVLDTLSKARFDVDDRLKSIHSNVLDRLSSINDQLSMDHPPLSFPRRTVLKSAKMQEKSASESRYRITSPKTPVTRLSSDRLGSKQISQSRQNEQSTIKEPVRFPQLPKFDLPQLSNLPWDTNEKLGSRNNDKSMKSANARKSIKVEKPERDIPVKPLPIVRKYINKPKENTPERASSTSQRNTAPRPDLRVKPVLPTPEIRRTQIKKPSRISPETRKWKMALNTTPSPKTNAISQKALLKSSLDENASSLSKTIFDPKERLRFSLKSQRDSLGASSKNMMSKTDAINERLKNNLAMHRQKAQENTKARAAALKPVVKVNISKMELPERTAFKDSPIANIQKRDSETEEDQMGGPDHILAVKPLAKVSNVNDFLDKLKQSVRTTLSTAGTKPTSADIRASRLQMKPEMMEGASEVFKSMIEKPNDPMKENIAYQCKLVCNKE